MLPRRGFSKPIPVPISARDSPGVDTWCGSHPEGKSYLGKLGSPTEKSAVSAIPPLLRPDEAAQPHVVVGQKFDGTKPIKRFLFTWTGEANTVAVAGSFNDWTDPIELRRVRDCLSFSFSSIGLVSRHSGCSERLLREHIYTERGVFLVSTRPRVKCRNAEFPLVFFPISC